MKILILDYFKSQFQFIVPPKWIQEPRDIQAVVGQDITLPCLVEGFPKPSTVWTRTNGKKMFYFLNRLRIDNLNLNYSKYKSNLVLNLKELF